MSRVPLSAPTAGTLHTPGRILALPSGTWLVADTGNHSLVEVAEDDAFVLRRIGTGEEGLTDGGPRHARFAGPDGLCLLPAEVAAHVRYDVVVADTGNGRLRGVGLSDGVVRSVAGSGRPYGPESRGVCPARAADLSVPWDVVWFENRVVVSTRGDGRLWEFDPVGESLELLAGGTAGYAAGYVEGALDRVRFTGPCALAAAGHTLWIADAGAHALRRLHDGYVRTVAGGGPGGAGHRDGPGPQARLRRPQGLAVLPDGSVLVCDTGNGALRRYDPATGAVTTLLTGLQGPSATVVVREEEGLHLGLVETRAHRVRGVQLFNGTGGAVAG